MRITDIVKRINQRMNYESYSYDELLTALDSAIDYINSEWRVNLPMITDTPEMIMDPARPGNMIAAEYTALPDDFIRLFIVPFAAAKQYTINEQDPTPEVAEYTLAFSRLSVKYQVGLADGATEIKAANYAILTEDTTDQFMDGNSNYGYDQRGTGDDSDLNPSFGKF